MQPFRFPLYANKKEKKCMSCLLFFSVPSAVLGTAPFSSPPLSANQRAECASFLHFQFLKSGKKHNHKASLKNYCAANKSKTIQETEPVLTCFCFIKRCPQRAVKVKETQVI